MKNLLTIISAVLFSLLAISSTQAVVITLTGGDPGEGYTPSGTPVYAYHMYGGAPTGSLPDPGSDTIQGITFQSLNVFNPPAGFSVSTFVSNFSYSQDGSSGIGASSNDTALQNMMIDGLWYTNRVFGNNDGSPAIITLGNLIAGRTYQVDLFALNHNQPLPQDTQFTFNGGQTNHFSEVEDTYYDVMEDVVANGSGQIVIDFSSPLGVGSSTGIPRFHAFSVELIPEPSAAMLLGLGCIGLLRRKTGASRLSVFPKCVAFDAENAGIKPTPAIPNSGIQNRS